MMGNDIACRVLLVVSDAFQEAPGLICDGDADVESRTVADRDSIGRTHPMMYRSKRPFI